MKIVVVGGTGHIGSRLVRKLRAWGHEAVPASPTVGVDTVTGKGLAAALRGASVVVDVSKPPGFDPEAVQEFFDASTRNLLTVEGDTGVEHHVVLSIVVAERVPDNGHFRAKVVQEELVKTSLIPYSIVRATQFFEFIETIAEGATVGDAVRLPPVLFQPMAADDVAKLVARVAVVGAVNGTVEIAGPDRSGMETFVRRLFEARGDRRRVLADSKGRYFGSLPGERALVPQGSVTLGAMHFDEWLRQSIEKQKAA